MWLHLEGHQLHFNCNTLLLWQNAEVLPFTWKLLSDTFLCSPPPPCLPRSPLFSPASPLPIFCNIKFEILFNVWTWLLSLEKWSKLTDVLIRKPKITILRSPCLLDNSLWNACYRLKSSEEFSIQSGILIRRCTVGFRIFCGSSHDWSIIGNKPWMDNRSKMRVRTWIIRQSQEKLRGKP